MVWFVHIRTFVLFLIDVFVLQQLPRLIEVILVDIGIQNT